MTSARLNELQSVDDLARACGVERDFIESYSESSDQAEFFNIVCLRKRGRRRRGEFRVVYQARSDRLAALHRSMSMIVGNSVDFGDQVQGFLKKRSIRTNAEKHLGAKVLLHADIKNFFDSITVEHVRSALIAEGAPVSMARVLARISTIDGLLRQGTRCSPMMANLVSQDIDRSFINLARAHQCVYTRYADDITFSGNDVPSDDSVREILMGRGFSLRDDKCFRQYKGRTQYVTGLSVTDSAKPRLPRRLKRRLRLMIHYIGKYGLDDHWSHLGPNPAVGEAWLHGMLRFASSIEPDLVGPWRDIFEDQIHRRSLCANEIEGE